eukprot:4925-Chlamydomonas_euryale.AAC.8
MCACTHRQWQGAGEAGGFLVVVAHARCGGTAGRAGGGPVVCPRADGRAARPPQWRVRRDIASMLKVDLHRTWVDTTYHDQLRMPLVESDPCASQRGCFWPVTAVVPIPCSAHAVPAGVALPSGMVHKSVLAVVCRHWGVLHRLGLPVPPDVRPLPDVLLRTSVPVPVPLQPPPPPFDDGGGDGGRRGRGGGRRGGGGG